MAFKNKVEDTPAPIEYIEVVGFKGLNQDMTAPYNKDFKYEIGKTYTKDLDDLYGFFIGAYLHQVFHYVPIGNNHRYFKVRARVPKKAWDELKNIYYYVSEPKIEAIEITIEREFTKEEIFQVVAANRQDKGPIAPEYWDLALEKGLAAAIKQANIDELVAAGYSYEFSKYALEHSLKTTAIALSPKNCHGMTVYERLEMILKYANILEHVGG